MPAKFKLSTFIRKVSQEQQESPHFAGLLQLLPEIYAAHCKPRLWTGHADTGTDREQLLYEGSRWVFDKMHRDFLEANRLEMTISGSQQSQDKLHVHINFARGREQWDVYTFTCYLEGGELILGMF